jgi:hypothetical protein
MWSVVLKTLWCMLLVQNMFRISRHNFCNHFSKCMWVFEYIFLMLIESIDQICFKLHSSDLNLHINCMQGSNVVGRNTILTHGWGIYHLGLIIWIFKRKKTKVSLYPKLWSSKGISTISKSIIFNYIGGENLFCIVGVLLYDVILTKVARMLCEEA